MKFNYFMWFRTRDLLAVGAKPQPLPYGVQPLLKLGTESEVDLLSQLSVECTEERPVSCKVTCTHVSFYALSLQCVTSF
jgi:hypothetical protein